MTMPPSHKPKAKPRLRAKTSAQDARRRVEAAPAPAPVAREAAADAVSEHIEAAIEDAAGVALDFEAFEAEFEEHGALSEESYALLGAAGVPRGVVDRHIEGRLAANEILRQEVFEISGGSERYARMMAWARQALTPEGFERLEEALSGAPAQIKEMISDLSAVYGRAASDPVAPATRRGSETAPKSAATEAGRAAQSDASIAPGGPAPDPTAPEAGFGATERFRSADQLARAIRDPRYRSDPAYREWVAETLARSDVFTRSGAAG